MNHSRSRQSPQLSHLLYVPGSSHFRGRFLRLISALPCLLLFFLIILIYSIFNYFYVYAFIAGSYSYDQTQNDNPLTIELPFFHNTEELSTEEIKFKKGLATVIIEHYLLFWLLFSIFRTMLTDPGGVPDGSSRWGSKAQDTFLELKEQELHKFIKLRKLTQGCFTRKEDKSGRVSKSLRGSNPDGVSLGNQNGHLIDEESPAFPEAERILLRDRALAEMRRQSHLRFCSKCRNFKPLRAHHCRLCARCVLKMDHHCHWMLNCIGFSNYKYFMNVLLYADLSLGFMAGSFSSVVMDVFLNPGVESFDLFVVMAGFFLMILILGLSFGFTCYHFWLIWHGRTTIEYCEKYKKGDGGDFDGGLFRNFKNVFNSNPFLWFFPLNRNEAGEGLYEEFENRESEEKKECG